MKKSARLKRRLAIALFALNLAGARAIAVTDPCQGSRVFFTASLSFKAIAKTVACQEWKFPDQRSLGEARPRYCAQDLEALRLRGKPALVAAVPATSAPLAARASRPARLYAFKLPADLSPVQPTHLHSKK